MTLPLKPMERQQMIDHVTAVIDNGPIMIRVFDNGRRVDAVLPNGDIQIIHPRTMAALPVPRGPGRPFKSTLDDDLIGRDGEKDHAKG